MREIELSERLLLKDIEKVDFKQNEYLKINKDPMTRYAYRFLKRAFDVVFSSLVVLLLFVPSLLLCLMIIVDSKGAPFYLQKRIGRNGKSFIMYKFRSMVENAEEMLEELRDKNEADGPLFKIENDPRMTRIGRFLRKHSIDEIPQFLNVLGGTMSIVGPRPCLPGEYAVYGEYARQRVLTKPGITGYWQTRKQADLSFDASIELDLRYIEESGFLLDLSVIAKTIPVILSGRNSS